MEWIALLFDGNPRALLHDVARVRVFSLWTTGAHGLGQAGPRQCAEQVRAGESWVGPERSRGPRS